MSETFNLDDVWAILSPIDTQYFQAIAGAASPESFDAYENAVGFKLPAEFRSLSLSKLGGLYITARDEVWPPAKLFDVGPAWTFWRGVMVFGVAPDVPDWLSLNVMLAEVREQGIDDFAPVLKVEGDSTLYGFRPDGSISVFDGYELTPDEAGSFFELYKREIDALVERLGEMKALQSERSGS